MPNPRLSLIYQGIDLCRKEGVDFILAVGGGSVIDSAKAIGYGVADEEQGDVWDFYEKIREPKACLPGGVGLTLSAAGAEMRRDLAEKCSHFVKRTVGCVKKLDKEDMYQIYRKAR